MGYLTVLHVSLGAKFGDLHAKDSHSFHNEQIYPPHRLFAYAHSPTQLNGTPGSTEHEPHHVILKP